MTVFPSMTWPSHASLVTGSYPARHGVLGNRVYDRRRAKVLRASVVPYAKLLRFVPFYPSLGNHDVKTDDGAPWLRAFVLPENGPDGVDPERFYWFDYGDARFVALDTTREHAAQFG